MKISKERFQKAAANLTQTRIMVIGDIILDEYLVGEVNRISPEAPVPVLWVRKESITLGGAGNVIKNLHALGCQTSVYARCGQDEKSVLLKKLLLEENIKAEEIHLLHSAEIPTTIKTRMIAGHQQICRVDREEIIPLTESQQKEVLTEITKNMPRTQGIILSDYDKGYFNREMIDDIVQNAIANQCYISVDPQVGHFSYYKRVSILTPNHHEAGRFLGRKLVTDEEVEEGAREITSRLNAQSLMITRGDKGMTLFLSSTNTMHHIPTVAKEVFDVTGAGDTVISVYTAFKLGGLDEREASIVANAAASVVIAHLGAATASVAEIQARLEKMDLFLS